MGATTPRRRALAAARKSAGHTQESLAEALHVDRSTVIRWEAGDYAPLPYVRPKLARLLGRSQEQLRDLIEPAPVEQTSLGADIEAACAWLDRQLEWRPGTARGSVASRLRTLSTPEVLERNLLRAKVGRGDIVRALLEYYGGDVPGHGLYRGAFDDHVVDIGVLTRLEWLDVACPLAPARDQILLDSSSAAGDPALGINVECAVNRLVEAVKLGTPLANLPIYRLLDVDVRAHAVTGRIGLVPFLHYALTMDLLEGELFDSVLGDDALMPLRDAFLPDLDSVLNVSERVCAGGVVALCAIARPAEHGRPRDYALLIQERSARVLNAAQRLAVIPKGFHQPLADYGAEARIGATLRREMEEELFGRQDVDGTLDVPRALVPMHRSRLSGPMRWLTDADDRMRLECTGFGFNLVSGNYEFACLIVLEDEGFCSRFGGHIEANWEARGIRLYSTVDRELLGTLVADEAWSNEGLFALLQGLRRLSEIGGSRVNLPSIDWELR